MLERGYNIQDEVFLHREQRGKLPGMEILSSKEDRQWAGAGLEGKIVRRYICYVLLLRLVAVDLVFALIFLLIRLVVVH